MTDSTTPPFHDYQDYYQNYHSIVCCEKMKGESLTLTNCSSSSSSWSLVLRVFQFFQSLEKPPFSTYKTKTFQTSAYSPTHRFDGRLPILVRLVSLSTLNNAYVWRACIFKGVQVAFIFKIRKYTPSSNNILEMWKKFPSRRWRNGEEFSQKEACVVVSFGGERVCSTH